VSTVKVAAVGRVLESVGANVLRYSLVFFLLFFGALKWTVDEARGVNPLIVNSPFLSWTNHLFGMQGASEFIGVIELAVAVLIGLRRWKPPLFSLGKCLGCWDVSGDAQLPLHNSECATGRPISAEKPLFARRISLDGGRGIQKGRLEWWGSLTVSTKVLEAIIRSIRRDHKISARI